MVAGAMSIVGSLYVYTGAISSVTETRSMEATMGEHDLVAYPLLLPCQTTIHELKTYSEFLGAPQLLLSVRYVCEGCVCGNAGGFEALLSFRLLLPSMVVVNGFRVREMIWYNSKQVTTYAGSGSFAIMRSCKPQ